MGLFVVILLAIVTVLLIRNMNKRLRRLPDSFADPAKERRAAEVARLQADLVRDEKRGLDSEAEPAAATVVSDVEGARPDAEVKGADGAGRAKGDGERP